MKTINSLSGGKTSSYIAANYPADYNIFALVRTNDKRVLFQDKKVRQIVSDKIGQEFIGTLEEDAIIYTMLDLEQFIGQEIKWVSGITFDEVISGKYGGVLPNKLRRYCTSEMKMKPIFKWWLDNIGEPVEMRIGFRANEMSRAKSQIEKLNKNGLLTFKTIIGKIGNRNKWSEVEWQKPTFPLIEDSIFKDTIEEFWKDKPVRFAYMNNCVGCFHRDPILLKYMSEREPDKFDWFCRAEKNRKHKYDTWKESGHLSYEQIKNHKLQFKLFEDDFTDCDSGYCGL